MFPDNSRLISLLISALVAGFVVLINLDRQAADLGVSDIPVSQHGWPLVYLLRQRVEAPAAGPTAIAIPSRWPWPIDETEVRTFSSTNLTTDIIVGAAIIGIVYMMTHTLMRQFLKRGNRAESPTKT